VDDVEALLDTSRVIGHGAEMGSISVIGVTRVCLSPRRTWPAMACIRRVGPTSFLSHIYIIIPSMLVASLATALLPLVPLVAASKVELPPQVHHQLLHSGRPQVGLWKALLSGAQNRQASQLG
jgi:hypothetical protein